MQKRMQSRDPQELKLYFNSMTQPRASKQLELMANLGIPLLSVSTEFLSGLLRKVHGNEMPKQSTASSQRSSKVETPVSSQNQSQKSSGYEEARPQNQSQKRSGYEEARPLTP
jgi:hypothetical protein